MKQLLLICLLLIPAHLWAEVGSVQIPWQEFSVLYKESIEKKIEKDAEKEKQPIVFSIDRANYRVNIKNDYAKGTVSLSGRVVSGETGEIPLLDNKIMIDKILSVSGGVLSCKQGQEHGIVFIPSGNEPFKLELSFLLKSQEDEKSRFVSMKIPKALLNSLKIDLPSDVVLLEYPGVKTAAGSYYFSPESTLSIRYLEKKRISKTSVIEIDTLSVVRIKGRQSVVTTYFAPVQQVSSDLILSVSESARFLSSSLKRSWLSSVKNGNYIIKLPKGEKNVFSIQLAYDESDSGEKIMFSLPSVKKNNGKEGCFILEEPDDGKISLDCIKPAVKIPVLSLNEKLKGFASKERFFMKIPVSEKINLSVKRFQAVSTPPIVLDSVSFYTSFEDNGGVLSILVMDIPPDAGKRMTIKAVQGAEIWSLTVNGHRQKVYGDKGGNKNSGLENWIIPLSRGETSHVELAYISQKNKPGLRGRLETIMPETGLPARNVFVGIALPSRLQLLSLEGPVSPSNLKVQDTPAEFKGNPYYFARSFYKGEGMSLAVSYREPATGK